jgi:hypothetical protein
MKPQETTLPRRKRSESDDEAEFWRRWPKASRYWTPDERRLFEAYLPGWQPGCDLNTVCYANKAKDPQWREPLWSEWPRLRAAWPSMVYLPTVVPFRTDDPTAGTE